MNYVRHSPSSLNLFSSCLSMFVLDRILGHRQPVGLAAFRGTAVEAGIAHGLEDLTRDPAECVEVAERKFSKLAALSSDERLEKVAKSIGPMVHNGLRELRPYGTPSSTQQYVEWHPVELKYPIVGFYDFAWEQHGVVVDLKTTEALPSKIKIPHARQVGLYSCAISDNIDGRLTYVTPSKVATYRLENIREHRNALLRMAMACERFLALSDDPQTFIDITAPDLDSFYFAPPAARAKAFEVWNV